MTTRGRAADCHAKGAIYGGDNRPVTPEHVGKKMVAGAGAGTGATPYATFNGAIDPASRYPADFHSLPPPKAFAEKVGIAEIMPGTYLEQTRLRHAVNAASRARNSGGPSPYATDAAQAGGDGPLGDGNGAFASAKEHVPLPRGPAEPAGKISGEPAFDPAVYAAARAENTARTEQSRIKLAAAGTPYATSVGTFDDLRRREHYHPKKRADKNAGANPFSAPDFDPEVYRQQLADNLVTQEESRNRKYGSGNILAPGAWEKRMP